MELPPKHPKQLRDIAEEGRGPLDHRMAARAESDQQIELRDPGLAMVDGEDALDRRGPAAPAGITVPAERLVAKPGEVEPVGAVSSVAARTKPPGLDGEGAAAAEEHPLA